MRVARATGVTPIPRLSHPGSSPVRRALWCAKPPLRTLERDLEAGSVVEQSLTEQAGSRPYCDEDLDGLGGGPVQQAEPGEDEKQRALELADTKGLAATEPDESVAISATFATRLADWFAEAVVERGASADGYVWPGRDGGPMDPSTAGQALGPCSGARWPG